MEGKENITAHVRRKTRLMPTITGKMLTLKYTYVYSQCLTPINQYSCDQSAFYCLFCFLECHPLTAFKLAALIMWL